MKPGLLVCTQTLFGEIGDNQYVQEENSHQVYCAN